MTRVHERVRTIFELHHEELYNLCASLNIITVIKSKRVEWERHVARMIGMRNAYNLLDGKHERKRQFGRPKHRCDDNIRMDRREMG
jgi:hypothetical protein